MAQTLDGAKLLAARHLGIPLNQYLSNMGRGLKWCSGCKQWHRKICFGRDITRYDRLSTVCVEFRKQRQRKRYIHKIRISRKGWRFAIPRDGDKLQARHRANHLVDIGLLPDPNNCECANCGHIYKKGNKRHEYHHESYAADKQEIVVALCSKCHRNQDIKKRKENELE